MTVDQIKLAIRNKSIVEFAWDDKLWGTLTCMSDDETCVYYKRLGMGLFRYCTTIDQVKYPM